MKCIVSILLPLIFLSCANVKERNFAGSTTANKVVRSFLGISLTDSIDFIRWKISLRDNQYQLSCNYGVGKPNTRGFYNGGKRAGLNGSFKEEKHYLLLIHGDKILGLAKLNEDVVHLLDTDRSLLAGTGGWSYTLNAQEKASPGELKFLSNPITVQDSITFHGRTPCVVFGEDNNRDCYRLKWSIVLYADQGSDTFSRFKLRGTVVQPETKTNAWSGVLKQKNIKEGITVYELDPEKGEPLYFLLLENIMVLTDKEGKMLVGDEDFSYTLSRK